MAKPGFNVKKNFSFKKLGRKLPAIMAENLNELGNWINKGIQDGIEAGKDINDKSFAPLSDESTTILRPGGKPLLGEKRSQNLRNTKITRAKANDLKFVIEATGKSQASKPLLGGRKVKRKKSGVIYGAFHNQKGGYVTSPKSAIPNKDVPQRKWFGIPKSAMPPNGKNYKKATLNRRLRISRAIRTIMS